MRSSTVIRIRVADEVWIATALLHREHADQPDFSLEEIVERVQQEALHSPLRPSVYVHVVQHCVANRPPNPGRYRMLFETSEGRRRLYRTGDSYHVERKGSKVTPDPEDLPNGYKDLLNWYQDWCEQAVRNRLENDPLLLAQGSGKHLWAEPGDGYVRRLREGWE